MAKPLYVFATAEEAAISLERGLSSVLICGMQPIPSAVALMRHLCFNTCSEVINIGFAGSLKDHHRFGEIYAIDTLGKLHHPELKVAASSPFPKAALFTSDYPIHSQTTRKSLGKNYDLVDMEGWALAWTCQEFGIPCRFFKIVSDFCSKTTPQEIRAKSKELSRIIDATFFTVLP